MVIFKTVTRAKAQRILGRQSLGVGDLLLNTGDK